MACAEVRRHDDVADRAAEHVGAGVAEGTLGGRVEFYDAPGLIYGDHAVQRGRRDGGVECLAHLQGSDLFRQPALGLLEVGQVPREDEVAVDGAGLAPVRDVEPLNEALIRAFGVGQPAVPLHRLSAKRPLAMLEHGLERRRANHLRHGTAQERVRRLADEPCVFVVHVAVAAIPVHQRDTSGDPVQDRVELQRTDVGCVHGFKRGSARLSPPRTYSRCPAPSGSPRAC